MGRIDRLILYGTFALLLPSGAALAADARIELALQLANFAAGVVVEKLGTATASPEEIVALVGGNSGG